MQDGLSALKSYARDGKGARTLQIKPKVSRADDRLIPPPLGSEAPMRDANWVAANHATARLLQQTGAVEPAKRMRAYNEGTFAAVAPPDQSKRRATAADNEDDEDFLQKILLAAKTPAAAAADKNAVTLPMAKVAPDVTRFDTMEHYKRRDNQMLLFQHAHRVERPPRASTKTIIETPPPTATLQYCATFRNEFAWFDAYEEQIARSADVTYQKVPLIRRAVLQTFLRAPDPHTSWERPCFNLDRDPMPHEKRVRCIAHQLSARALGDGNAFRCRELLFNGQSVKINEALEHNPKADVDAFLSPLPELCYMCHVWMTTAACLDQKNKADQRKRTDMTNVEQANPTLITIFNRFMVDIDKPGEYDRRAMLASDDVALGVWGPFPLWNDNNYVPVKVVAPDTGAIVWGFEERDQLVFRLSGIPSHPIGRSAAQSVSIRSDPTSATRADLSSLQ